MRLRRPIIAAVAALSSTAAVTGAGAAGPTGPTVSGSTVLTAVRGAAPILLAGATDLGVAPSRTEHATFALALRDAAGLRAAVARHQVLSVGQLATHLPSGATVGALSTWARSAGLTVTASRGTLVSVSAPTAVLDAALRTTTHVFRAGDGHAYRSIATTVALPAALAPTVAGITGLSDAGSLHLSAHPTARPAARAATFPQTFGPKELAAFYDAPASATGAGQTVGVIAEGALGQVVTDLRTFEGTFGLPQVPVTIKGAGSADAAGQDEYDLDTQYATGEAPGVSGLTVYDGASLSNNDILQTINAWATDPAGPATASFSAGECELLAGVTGLTASLDQVLLQAAAAGRSLFVSSGDNGGYCGALVNTNGIPGGIPGVEYPASSAYAVAVGGTTVTGAGGSAWSPTSEIAWNAGGGGISTFETAPSWQPLPVVAQRGVPDVALDADPLTGYSVVVNGTVQTIGGTSASAPAWNGYWARALGARGALGFAPPRLYAATSGFHDVLLGTNGLHVATPGYDYTTGLGTPAVAKLIPAL